LRHLTLLRWGRGGVYRPIATTPASTSSLSIPVTVTATADTNRVTTTTRATFNPAVTLPRNRSNPLHRNFAHRRMIMSSSASVTSTPVAPAPDSAATQTPASASSSATRSAATPSLPPFSIVVAATQSGGIGLNGGLPWPRGSLPTDMAHFKRITMSTDSNPSTSDTDSSAPQPKLNAVIMGRRTWQSIPTKFRPLPGRINVILSRTGVEDMQKEVNDAGHADTYVQPSLYSALQFLSQSPSISSRLASVFIIGGSGVYKEALSSPLCHRVYLTRVLKEFECDTFLQHLDTAGPNSTWKLSQVGEVQSDPAVESLPSGIPFQFQILDRRHPSLEWGNPEEQQYLDLVRRVLEEGVEKGDRTGTGTRSLFGAQMRFSLRDGKFPLLTSKRVFWRGVVEELIWSGEAGDEGAELRSGDPR